MYVLLCVFFSLPSLLQLRRKQTSVLSSFHEAFQCHIIATYTFPSKCTQLLAGLTFSDMYCCLYRLYAYKPICNSNMTRLCLQF